MTILVTLQAQLIVGEEQVIKSPAPEGGCWRPYLKTTAGPGISMRSMSPLKETRFLMQCISTMSRIYQTPTFLLTLKSAGLKTVRSACSLSTDIRMQRSISWGKMGTAEADTHPRLTRFGLCPAMNGATR
jgi:hypothetical protein